MVFMQIYPSVCTGSKKHFHLNVEGCRDVSSKNHGNKVNVHMHAQADNNNNMCNLLPTSYTTARQRLTYHQPFKEVDTQSCCYCCLAVHAHVYLLVSMILATFECFTLII